MAATAIPGLDVIEGYPIETPKGKVPTPRPTSAEGFATMRSQANPSSSLPNTPIAKPAGFDNPGAPDASPRATPSEPLSLRRAATASVDFAKNGLRAAASMAPPIIAGNLAARSGGVLSNTGVGEDVPTGVPADPGYLSRVNAIPGQPEGTVAPTAQPGNFFRDTEIGRNIANTANAAGGATSAMGAMGQGIQAIRAGSTASKVLVPTAAATEAFSTANAFGLRSPAAQAPVASPIPTATPSAAPPQPAETAPAPVASFPGVSTIGGGEEGLQRNLRASAIMEQNRGLIKQLDAYGAGAHTADGSTGGAVSLSGGGQSVADLAKSGKLTAAGLSSVVNARGQDSAASTAAVGNQVTLRGQDLQEGQNIRTNQTAVAGQQATLRAAQATAQRAQANTDKEFNAQQTERDRLASESAQKAVRSNLEAKFRTTDDKDNSIPDASKIADYTTALDATVPGLIKALQAKGTPTALAKAQELSKRGAAALNPEDHDQLTQLYERRELARQARGVLPGSGDFVDSPNLLDYTQAEGEAGVTRGIFADRVNLRNGTSVNTRTLQRGTPINDFNVFGGALTPETTQYTRGLRN